MKITCLMDNKPFNEKFKSQHGLSILIETGDRKILMDSGSDSSFLLNAIILGEDINDVDLFVLSHGHYDHGGGLMAFISENDHAPVYVRDNAFGCFFHEKKDGIDEYIGLDHSLKDCDRLIRTDGNLKEIADGIYLFSNVRGRKLWPDGNRELVRKEGGRNVQDDFSHEQYLVIRENDRYVLVSGCAHNGIVNILDEFRKLFGRDPDCVVSGFHMMKKSYYNTRDLAVIRETAEILKKGKSEYYTGHCTSGKGYRALREILKDKIKYLHSGESFTV